MTTAGCAADQSPRLPTSLRGASTAGVVLAGA
jgi:hypothetical protein